MLSGTCHPQFPCIDVSRRRNKADATGFRAEGEGSRMRNHQHRAGCPSAQAHPGFTSWVYHLLAAVCL